jgi:SET domain-containing protein
MPMKAAHDTFLGYGVFATKHFEKHEFLLEYVGKFIDPRVADAKDDQELLYYFELSGKNYWYV